MDTNNQFIDRTLRGYDLDQSLQRLFEASHEKNRNLSGCIKFWKDTWWKQTIIVELL